MASLAGATAIAGIGATEYSRNSGRSELQLACEAVIAALADAGIEPGDVDGLVTTSFDNNLEIEVFRNIGGRELTFFSRIGYGGGAACGPLHQAAMAVATGVAKVVVCYRAMNERSEYRYGSASFIGQMGAAATSDGALKGLHTVHGLKTAAAMVALPARRYMHRYGVTSSDFAQVAIACRRHAAVNPGAFFYGRPITLEDHQNSKMIADPLRLLDCCLESDGACAVVVTSTEHARDLRQKPAILKAAAQGAYGGQISLSSFYHDDLSYWPETELVSRQLYEMGGVSPADIGVAILYDHFTSSVLMQLEAYGFCRRGEAKDFVKDGNIEVGGGLPVNTHGGALGEAYIHGMNGIVEGVKQIRGASFNQVAGVEHVLVSSGPSAPTSGVILAAH